MSLLASIRPDSWNFALLLHVGGAMILVGGMLAGVSALAFARGDARMLRLGYCSLLAVALPGYVEGLDNGSIDFAWAAIGFIVAEAGGLLLLIALIVGGIGVRRLSSGRGTDLLTVTMGISLVLLVAYVVAIWAMSAKPT